jgi:hypothetical protein
MMPAMAARKHLSRNIGLFNLCCIVTVRKALGNALINASVKYVKAHNFDHEIALHFG